MAASPHTLLKSLKLNKSKANTLLNLLIDDADSMGPIRYTDGNGNNIDITFSCLSEHSAFAKISCCKAAAIEDKEAFIRSAIESALRQSGLPYQYQNIAVGGIIADMGRLAMLLSFFQSEPKSTHAFAVFKCPGETHCTIENPRPDIISIDEKLQSRFNDQVCVYAATTITYYLHQFFKTHPKQCQSTTEMIKQIYQDQRLRNIISQLENKVDHSHQTLAEVFSEFTAALKAHTNPIRPTIRSLSASADSRIII